MPDVASPHGRLRRCGASTAPGLEYGEADGDQCRSDEKAEKAEGDEAAEHAQDRQAHRHRHAKADQPGLDDIVHHGDDKTQHNKKNAPALLVLAKQPNCGATPDRHDQRRADLAERKQQRDKAEQGGARNSRDDQADRHHDGLDNGGSRHPVGHTAHRARRDVQLGSGGFAAKLPEEFVQPCRQGVAADPEQRRYDQRQDDLQHTGGERPGRPDEQLAQCVGVWFEKGPDAPLGVHRLVPYPSEARADDRQPGDPGRGLRSAGEVVLHAMRPCVNCSARPGATAIIGSAMRASARSSSNVAASPRFSPHRSKKSRSGHPAMARIAPNKIAVVKGSSTARMPTSRPPKSNSRTARSRSCVLLAAAATRASSFTDGISLAIGYLPDASANDTRFTPQAEITKNAPSHPTRRSTIVDVSAAEAAWSFRPSSRAGGDLFLWRWE